MGWKPNPNRAPLSDDEAMRLHQEMSDAGKRVRYKNQKEEEDPNRQPPKHVGGPNSDY
jgi:hypothetical protein